MSGWATRAKHWIWPFQALVEDPLNPLLYRQLADVFVEQGRRDDAATALMEGMIVTQDMDLRSELVKLYRSAPGCAIRPRGRTAGPCLVSSTSWLPSFTNIFVPLAETRMPSKCVLDTGRRDIAEQMKRSFLVDYACPAGPIHQAMGEKPGS